MYLSIDYGVDYVAEGRGNFLGFGFGSSERSIEIRSGRWYTREIESVAVCSKNNGFRLTFQWTIWHLITLESSKTTRKRGGSGSGCLKAKHGQTAAEDGSRSASFTACISDMKCRPFR